MLTTDLRTEERDCIEVTADDVVVDGDDHLIRRTTTEGRGGAGVVAPRTGRVENLTVHDLSVRSFGIGVWLHSTTNATVRNVSATHNGVGVRVSNSSSVSISDATVADSRGAGLLVGGGRDLHVRASVRANGGAGVVLDSPAAAIVEDTTLRENDGAGVFLWRSRGSELSNLTAVNNGNAGLYVFESPETTVSNVTATFDAPTPTDWFAVTVVESPRSTIERGTIRGHSGGVVVRRSADSTVRNLVVDGTTDRELVYGDAAGARVVRSPNAIVRGLTIDGRRELVVARSDGALVADNRIVTRRRRSSPPSIAIVDLANGNVTGNDVRGGGLSIVVDGGVDVSVVSNTIADARTGRSHGGNVVVEGERNVVSHNRITDSALGVVVEGPENTVSHNHVTNMGRSVVVDGPDNAVVDNQITRGVYGVVVRGTRTLVHDNAIDGVEYAVFVFDWSENVTVDQNVARGGQITLAPRSRSASVTENVVVDSTVGVSFRAHIDQHEIERNLIADNEIGVLAWGWIFQREPSPPDERYSHTRDARVRQNLLVGNQIGMQLIDQGYTGDVGPVEYVEVHENAFVENSVCGLAVEGRDPKLLVNATRNYWGPGGPASPASGVVTDPVTGRAANGRGDTVCPVDTDAVDETTRSFVHFDPVLSDLEARTLLFQVRRNATLPAEADLVLRWALSNTSSAHTSPGNLTETGLA